METIKLTRVGIWNFKGIQELEFIPRTVTVMEGANGTGKTSVIDAIKAVFEGGSHPEYIRHGEDKAVVQLELSSGHRIAWGQTATRNTLDIKGPDGKPLGKEATFMKSLTSGFAFDPLSFCLAPAKEMVSYLLGVSPIKVTGKEITDAGGKIKIPEAMAQDSLDGLSVIDAAVNWAIDQRKTANAEHKNLDATVGTLQGSVIDIDADEFRAAKERHESQLSETQTERNRLARRFALELEEKKDEIRGQSTESVTKLEEQIAAIKLSTAQQIEQAIAALREEQDGALSELDDIGQQIKVDLATIDAKLQEAARSSAMKDLLAENRKQLKAAADRASYLDLAVEKLRKLRTAKAKDLPIAGLEVKGGEVYFEGTLFRELNTERQYRLAVQIGLQRETSLSFMVIDNAEAIDDHKWAAFVRAIETIDPPVQIVAARVVAGKELEVVS